MLRSSPSHGATGTVAHIGGIAEITPGEPALLFHPAQLPARKVDRATPGADPPSRPSDSGWGGNPTRGGHGEGSGAIDRYPPRRLGALDRQIDRAAGAHP